MIRCHHCHQIVQTGQVPLTEREKRVLPTSNQHSEEYWDVIKWRCVKGAAVYFEVEDWTSKVDTDLTYEENIQLMSENPRENHRSDGRTMRDIQPISGIHR